MLITEKESLKNYTSQYRIWQGIPSIEVTKKGRIFVTFYSGGTDEEIGNYSMVVMSDDGVSFTEPVVVAYKENYRCFDPCLWLDPLGRLWFTWSVMPLKGVYGAICEDPDAGELVWSDVFFIGQDVMLNKPTVLSTGEWMFPVAVWDKEKLKLQSVYYDTVEEHGAFVYKSVDNGKTFEKLGGADIFRRQFDEHMIVELKDERLAMYVRTGYGIGVSYSYDRGRSWTAGENSYLGGPGSRFHIRRLKSGRLLLINHVDFKGNNLAGRNNLTALLSDDDGVTWKYRLLLDARDSVAYPDAKEAEDGFIYITYDRERGYVKHSLKDAYDSAREILYAKITEEDIMAGKLVNQDSKLKCVVSKLGKYAGDESKLLINTVKYSGVELAQILLEKYPNDIVNKIFEYYPWNCACMHEENNDKLDALIKKLEESTDNKLSVVEEIISFIRSASSPSVEAVPLVERVKEIILNNLEKDLTVSEIAQKVGMSVYYMQHQFRKSTKVTVTDYKNELKITQAKKMLIHTPKSMTEIAHDCGFCSSSYFAEVFQKLEHVSPSEYRSRFGFE